MKKFLLATALIAPLMISAVQAAPISDQSAMSIVGVNSINDTQIGFPQNGHLLISAGDFAGLGTCFNCVTLPAINFQPEILAGQFFSVTNAGLTATFSFNDDAIWTNTPGTPGTMQVLGTGVATLTGYDPTPGYFSFTTQNGVAMNVTYSATITAASPVSVPEPASMALFGMGLLGLGLVRNIKKTGIVTPGKDHVV